MKQAASFSVCAMAPEHNIPTFVQPIDVLSHLSTTGRIHSLSIESCRNFCDTTMTFQRQHACTCNLCKSDVMHEYCLFVCEHLGTHVCNDVVRHCASPDCCLDLLLQCANCRQLLDRHYQITMALIDTTDSARFSKIELLYENFTPSSRLPLPVI